MQQVVTSTNSPKQFAELRTKQMGLSLITYGYKQTREMNLENLSGWIFFNDPDNNLFQFLSILAVPTFFCIFLSMCPQVIFMFGWLGSFRRLNLAKFSDTAPLKG